MTGRRSVGGQAGRARQHGRWRRLDADRSPREEGVRGQTELGFIVCRGGQMAAWLAGKSGRPARAPTGWGELLIRANQLHCFSIGGCQEETKTVGPASSPDQNWQPAARLPTKPPKWPGGARWAPNRGRAGGCEPAAQPERREEEA